jgi:hypothetical protein
VYLMHSKHRQLFLSPVLQDPAGWLNEYTATSRAYQLFTYNYTWCTGLGQDQLVPTHVPVTTCHLLANSCCTCACRSD